MTAGPHQPTKTEQLAAIIASMHEAIPELFGVMIASIDGLAVAHDLPEPDAERIAAMSAAALGLGARITERTNVGTLTETIIRGTQGHLVVYAAGKHAVLVMSGPLTANLTLMRIEARVATVQINSLLGRH
jgi:predicted regulator of Ras-like GTPase activity (Roadblock/LC7/MglB family)